MELKFETAIDNFPLIESVSIVLNVGTYPECEPIPISNIGAGFVLRTEIFNYYQKYLRKKHFNI